MEPQNRAAITYYRTFQKALEKIAEIDPSVKSAAYKSQLSQLEQNLKNIKKIEPNYDTSTLEAEVEKYKNTINSQDKNKSLDKDLAAINKSFELFDKLLGETKLNTDNIELTIKGAIEPFNRDIAIFKKNHPDYSTAEFEAKVTDFQTKMRVKLEAAAGNVNDTNDLKNDLENLLYLKSLSFRDYEGPDFIYGSHNPTGNLYLPNYIWSQTGIDKLQSILDDYTQRFDKFSTKYNIDEIRSLYSIDVKSNNVLSKDENTRDYKVNSVLTYVRQFYEKSKSEFNEAKIQLKVLEEVSDFEVEDYFNNKIQALKWINASKLFNNVPEIVEVANKYQEVWNAYGSLDDYKEVIRKNSIKRAKLVKLPKAVKHDEEIEALVKVAFESKGWNEEVLKVILLGQDWRLERNSEFIIGRVYDVAIAAKQKTGICMLYNVTIRQEEVGDRFSLPFISSYNSKAIAEENI